ncbi:hypothetical protein PM082_021506 [Marasmius tenuissimus]|nr:hypothetical protein PM082_021506 [Marasmius tenuissimus]
MHSPSYICPVGALPSLPYAPDDSTSGYHNPPGSLAKPYSVANAHSMKFPPPVFHPPSYPSVHRVECWTSACQGAFLDIRLRFDGTFGRLIDLILLRSGALIWEPPRSQIISVRPKLHRNIGSTVTTWSSDDLR